jgi:hypothetical protein
MNENRFEELMGRLLDDDLASDELSELVRLAKEDPARQQELQAQLETAELLAQSEDGLRDGALFVSAVQSRMGDDRFVTSVRSAIRTGSPYRISRWVWAAGMAAAVVLMANLFFLRSVNEPKIATITGLSGAVLWTGNGGLVAEDLVVGAQVSGGTLEGMTPDSLVELQFRDGSTVTISGHSTLTFSDHGQKLLRLKEGNISASVTRQAPDKPMLIHTRTAMFEVLGTKFELDAELASTTLNVSEGKVRAKRLSDGTTVDVPAKYRVVASADRDLIATKVPQSVSLWKSHLSGGPDNTYGKWAAATTDEPARLRSIPYHIRRPHRDPWSIYTLSFDISRGDSTPVVLRPSTRFRVRGRMKSSHKLWFGVSMRHPNGDFAGRFQITKPAEAFTGGEDFDVVVNLGDFELDPSLRKWKDKLPSSADGLVVDSFYCHSLDDYVDLSVTSVELIAAMTPVGQAASKAEVRQSIQEEAKVIALNRSFP